MDNKIEKRVCVIVLGDIARSPRMINHTVELIKHTKVDLIGYCDTKVPNRLENANIDIKPLSFSFLHVIKKLPSIIYLIFRLFLEFLQMFVLLFIKAKQPYKKILIQNPPCFHVLPLLLLYKKLKKAEIIIDIHNYGFTLLSDRMSKFKKIFTFLEVFLIRVTGSRFLVVSEAMRENVKTKWKLSNITTLYDKPNRKVFKPITLLEKHYFLMKFPEFKLDDNKTAFTKCIGTEVKDREEGDLLLISNSSYSLDDDYDIFINALIQFDSEKRKRGLTVIMTGSGPFKHFWKDKMSSLNLSQVKILFRWFSNEDYPKIVACADFGVCLHKSSSGYDLPMKVLDLNSCRVPVLTLEYGKTIKELVTDKQNGLLFTSSDELTLILDSIVQNKEETQIKWSFDESNWSKEWE